MEEGVKSTPIFAEARGENLRAMTQNAIRETKSPNVLVKNRSANVKRVAGLLRHTLL